MKKPWEWDEADLSALIANGTQESVSLDYKQSEALAKTDAKKNELSKDVSAFANSGGGTIVYGMVEDRHVPVRLDAGLDPNEISKEWIDQVINSRIQRRIDGVRIRQVDLRATSPGRVAYVISVPQSTRGPHQASDKKFYKRFNFESVPMEEYEVRDVARRFEAPDLRLTYNLVIQPPKPDVVLQPGTTRILLNPIVTNEGSTPAEYAVITLWLDSRLVIPHPPAALRSGSGLATFSDTTYPCTMLSLNHAVPGKMPFFQGVHFSLLDEPLIVDFPSSGPFLLGSRLRSPRMAERFEACLLDSTGAVTQSGDASVA